MRSFIVCVLSAGFLFSAMPGNTRPISAEAYKSEMRTAWENHLHWKRNVIYNVIMDGVGLKTAIKHLSWNIGQITELLEPFYGRESATEISELLHAHSTYATNIAWALKVEDSRSFDDTYCRWINNANAMAGCLRSMNENWSLHELQYRWFAQLEYLSELARSRCEENFDTASSLFTLAHGEIKAMADYISEGVIKQFPEMFGMSGLAGN